MRSNLSRRDYLDEYVLSMAFDGNEINVSEDIQVLVPCTIGAIV